MKYEEIMLRAISEAEKYKYTAKPNPVVGAILIKDKEIISEGYHVKYGKNHAEVNAIINADKHKNKKFNDFSELVLICTLEPCSHIGKTGSCAHAIVKSGIKKVIIGSIDPNPKVSGKGVQILKENNIDVTVGIHQELVAKQNKFFFYRHANNKPYITVKIASSADGKSHYENHERVFITDEDARSDVQLLRAEYDAILTGTNTLLKDNPRMNARVNFPVNQPEKILMSTSFKMDSDKSEMPFFEGEKVTHFQHNDIDYLLTKMLENDKCSILVEAGPKLANAFLKTEHVDELIIYKSQKELGKNGISWFEQDNAVENYGFKLESSCKIGSDLKEIYKKDEEK
jgi:diaminohydroxyphosphoribosylaminopyrimidine deaminase/5-amino-6-(5-phosphoribosylamino)uracil reductase